MILGTMILEGVVIIIVGLVGMWVILFLVYRLLSAYVELKQYCKFRWGK